MTRERGLYRRGRADPVGEGLTREKRGGGWGAQGFTQVRGGWNTVRGRHEGVRLGRELRV